MKKDALKKHLFWVLSVVALVCLLMAFMFLTGGVSDAISKEKKDIEAAKTAVKAARAPGKGAITELEAQKKTLDLKKDDLWRENWEFQKSLFTWPKAPDNRFAKYEALKFGADLKGFDDFESDLLKRETVYKATYADMADRLAPTKFTGGWPAVMNERYITTWGEKKPEARQIWLLVEDIWVQRALLDPIKVVNDSAANFEVVPSDTPSPLKRSFRNKVWQIDLEVVDLPPNKVLKGKLTNRTGQLQLLGANNAMTLKVWLDPKLDMPPVDFKIEGEYVSGDESITPNTIPAHYLPAGTTVTELAKVEQILDDRTVPIREVFTMSLKKPSAKQFDKFGKDAANAKPPAFWPDEAAPADATPPPGGATAPAPMGRGEMMAGAPPHGGAAGAAGGGTLKGSVDDNRKRYLETTDQLRRMPVAITLILDQRYVQAALVAYTNSPLRFQTVQYSWKRFRGTLSSSTDPAGGSSGASGDVAVIPGNVGLGLQTAPHGEMRPGSGSRPIARGSLPGANAPPPPVRENPLPGSTSGDPFIPGLSSGALSSVSEGQANSSLVELKIYGIVTLYEKYDVKKDSAAPVAAVETPAAVPPAPTTPAPATPAPRGGF